MIFTSQQRFFKRRAPSTQTIAFNGEPTYRPLLSNGVTTKNNAFSPEPTKIISPQQPLRSMIRTYPGEAKRTCCGGAV